MIENPHIVILVMAAGASSRMKSIKQLLPWKNSNFLLEAIKTAKRSNAFSVHVVLGANAETIIKECNLTQQDVTLSVNQDWSLGLGNSIAFGVKNLIERKPLPDGILVCLADQPLLDTAYFNSLIQAFKKNTTKIVATNYRNSAGVPALFPKSFFSKLVLLKGDQGARTLLKENASNTICLDAEDQLMDIDTKNEYEQIRKQNNFQNEE